MGESEEAAALFIVSFHVTDLLLPKQRASSLHTECKRLEKPSFVIGILFLQRFCLIWQWTENRADFKPVTCCFMDCPPLNLSPSVQTDGWKTKGKSWISEWGNKCRCFHTGQERSLKGLMKVSQMLWPSTLFVMVFPNIWSFFYFLRLIWTFSTSWLASSVSWDLCFIWFICPDTLSDVVVFTHLYLLHCSVFLLCHYSPK